MSIFSKKSVGLVLGGGGARGFFHMGVIKALQELNIEINQISGTSIGDIVGAIYAADPKVDFEKMIKEIDYIKLTKIIITSGRDGFGSVVENFLKDYIKVENFSDLKIPLVFNAADINKKEEIVFNSGKIFPALIASISIPGVFPPTKINDSFLVDGGIVNNVPVSLLKAASKIIVSDITGPNTEINQETTAIESLYSSFAFMQQNISLQKIRKLKTNKIIYLNLKDNKTFILDFRKKNYNQLIDLGYRSMMEKKELI
jgi:NTE family protein